MSTTSNSSRFLSSQMLSSTNSILIAKQASHSSSFGLQSVKFGNIARTYSRQRTQALLIAHSRWKNSDIAHCPFIYLFHCTFVVKTKISPSSCFLPFLLLEISFNPEVGANETISQSMLSLVQPIFRCFCR